MKIVEDNHKRMEDNSMVFLKFLGTIRPRKKNTCTQHQQYIYI